MIFALVDFYAIIFDFINQAIFFIYLAAPKARKIAFQRLGMTKSIISVSVYVLDKLVNLFECLFVLRLPIDELFPGFFVKLYFHFAIASNSSIVFSTK